MAANSGSIPIGAYKKQSPPEGELCFLASDRNRTDISSLEGTKVFAFLFIIYYSLYN
jgi:hypothetical protein